ncbi:MAG: peptide chain release factor N(5)-glutamine methyltransferase [Clostridia bacterium]|nr:peptide chain release factor N(5)-glutamine methyltransferase [Bacillota bacterium]MBO2521901.1 peptide chain release factor N(5)-glutamine methyltransferase [Bacillota bacterium]
MASPRTVMDYLQLATGHLDASGVESPRLDAEVLLADLLGIERIQLYVQHDRPLTRLEVDAYRQRIARRARREPVAYITGKREFYSLELKVDRRCLIPRPETEHLVETALAELGRRFAGEACLDVADIGTGSGAIAAGVAKGEPRARVTATDIDAGALELAAENLARLGLSGRVQLVRGDLLEPLQGVLFHAILSNPPYIAESQWEHLPPDVRLYEPRGALLGGADGLDLIRRLIQEAWPRLVPRGFLALEIGHDQGEAVLELARARGYASAWLVQDLAGRDRVAVMAKE